MQPFAWQIKQAVGDKLVISSVGGVKTFRTAQDIRDNGIDLVTVGRMFQKRPGLVFDFADEAGITVSMPGQIRWAFAGRG